MAADRAASKAQAEQLYKDVLDAQKALEDFRRCQTLSAEDASKLEQLEQLEAAQDELKRAADAFTERVQQLSAKLQLVGRQLADLEAKERTLEDALRRRQLLPADLPAPPVYAKVNPADAPVLTLAVTSDTLPLTEVQNLVNTRLAQKISQVSGVGLVSLSGGQRPAMRIQADTQAMASYGLTLSDVQTAISAANANSAKGSFDGPTRSYTINANDQLLTVEDYSSLIVSYKNGAPIRLRDIAQVVQSAENTRLGAWANATPAIIVNVQRQPGANVIKTVDAIKAKLPELQAGLPATLDVQVLADRTTGIRASVHHVEIELLLAVALVVLVIFFFLHSLRATVIASLAVPISLIGSCGVMYLMGFSLNNLSLMAITVATGFVVDDAIVVLENTARHIEKGMDRFSAALLGARAAHMIRDYAKRDGYLAQVESFDQRPNLATLMTRAELLFDQRLTDDALHALEQVKKLAPKLTSGLRLELRIRQKRNEPEPMLKLLEQLQKSDAIDALQAEQLRLHAYLLQVQGNNGSGKQLRDWWAKLPASDRLQPRLAAAVARRLMSLGECQLAGKVIIDTLEKNWDQELIELFGQFPEWETPCTDNLLKNIQRAETWLPQHPNDADLLLALGRLCHAQELWGKAQSYLEASIAVRPSVAAHLELAEMLEQHGRHDQASPHFKTCLKLALHARQ